MISQAPASSAQLHLFRSDAQQEVLWIPRHSRHCRASERTWQSQRVVLRVPRVPRVRIKLSVNTWHKWMANDLLVCVIYWIRLMDEFVDKHADAYVHILACAHAHVQIHV